MSSERPTSIPYTGETDDLDARGTVLGDHVTLQRGTTYKSALLGQPGPVLLGLASIQRHGGFRDDKLRTYGGESPAKIVLGPGDLYVSLKDVTQSADVLGAVARVPTTVAAGRLTQDTVALKLIDGAMPSDYLYWLLRTRPYRAYCRAHAMGTTNLSLSRIDFLQFPVPPLTPMRLALVSVLDCVERKVQSNYRLSRTLEQLADAMFEHHVARSDFSTPGWESGDLTTLARFVNGRAFTKDANGRGRPIVRIKELNSGISGNTLYADLPAQDENVARHHELLFAWSGSLGLHRWHGPESLINQHIFKVIPNNEYPVWFVEAWLRRHVEEFRRIAADKATTMGHIKREHLKLAEVAIPPRDVLEELDAVLDPVDRQIGALASETITLLEVREALLFQFVEPAGVVTQLRSASCPLAGDGELVGVQQR